MACLWGKGNPYTLFMGFKSLWPLWRFLKKLKIELLYDQAIPHLGMYPMEPKSAYNRDTCTPVFIMAELRIA
jgi:hypothetical protein